VGDDDTLFQEWALCSVTANARQDGEELLALAARFAIRMDIVRYPMSDAPRALSELAHVRFSGAAVLCAA
jgi:propanol-preferring alcohol dehydrogenase